MQNLRLLHIYSSITNEKPGTKGNIVGTQLQQFTLSSVAPS